MQKYLEREQSSFLEGDPFRQGLKYIVNVGSWHMRKRQKIDFYIKKKEPQTHKGSMSIAG